MPTDLPRLQPETSMNKIVGLSGGKDSTAMALRLAETEPGDYDFAITPTGRELPPVIEHWKRLECLLGKSLTIVPAPTLIELIVKQRALPNFRMRWCTRMVKIEPFMAYVRSIAPATTYIGIRADEVTRERGVVIPDRTDCDCCYHQQIGEWWRLWRDYPDRYRECEAMESMTGYTFRSEQRDSWPAGLKELREKFEAGYIPKDAGQEKLPIDVASRPTMCAWCAR